MGVADPPTGRDLYRHCTARTPPRRQLGEGAPAVVTMAVLRLQIALLDTHEHLAPKYNLILRAASRGRHLLRPVWGGVKSRAGATSASNTTPPTSNWPEHTQRPLDLAPGGRGQGGGRSVLSRAPGARGARPWIGLDWIGFGRAAPVGARAAPADNGRES